MLQLIDHMRTEYTEEATCYGKKRAYREVATSTPGEASTKYKLSTLPLTPDALQSMHPKYFSCLQILNNKSLIFD